MSQAINSPYDTGVPPFISIIFRPSTHIFNPPLIFFLQMVTPSPHSWGQIWPIFFSPIGVVPSYTFFSFSPIPRYILRWNSHERYSVNHIVSTFVLHIVIRIQHTYVYMLIRHWFQASFIWLVHYSIIRYVNIMGKYNILRRITFDSFGWGWFIRLSPVPAHGLLASI